MFSQKLKALDYYQSESFNIQDESQARNLIVWLEDKKIRFYKIEERDALRNITSPGWVQALKKYLKDLQCPVVNLSNKAAVVHWLLSHAVKIQYLENASHYNTPSSDHFQEKMFANLTINDPSVQAGIDSLAKLFHVPQHDDKLILLQAITSIIEQRLSEASIKENQKQCKSRFVLKLEEVPLGFSMPDEGVTEALKILRLLQINHLRELQTQINQAIVAVQRISANPKTDHSLGMVGR